MKAKMFASLEEAIGKWVDKQVETPEWSQLDFYYPADFVLNITKAAALVFDAMVDASKESEENK